MRAVACSRSPAILPSFFSVREKGSCEKQNVDEYCTQILANTGIKTLSIAFLISFYFCMAGGGRFEKYFSTQKKVYCPM